MFCVTFITGDRLGSEAGSSRFNYGGVRMAPLKPEAGRLSGPPKDFASDTLEKACSVPYPAIASWVTHSRTSRF